MSQNLRNFTRAVYGLDAVVNRVPDAAWDNPSPCEGWSARDVVGHQIGVLDGVTRAARGEELGMPSPPDELPDPVGAWAACRDGVLEALDHEGALQRAGAYWFGEMSVDELISIVQWDPLTHAWDVSRATGLDPVPDHELARLSHATVEPRIEAFRKMRLVGDSVEVDSAAQPMDRFLGLIGRNPA